MAREGDYKRAQAAAKFYYNNLNQSNENLTKD